jgi:chemotaxis protein CheD
MGSVRMGEIEVSCRAGDELVARGLGSCIGLALVDRSAGIAGLAHIVLPESTPTDRQPGKFADLAVPELIDRIVRAGASRRRLEAVLAGGARMFELGELDIGARNAEAVRSGLAASGLSVRAAETGGSRGRTLRVEVGDCTVTAKEAGGESITLLDGSARAARRARVAAAATAATPMPTTGVLR